MYGWVDRLGICVFCMCIPYLNMRIRVSLPPVRRLSRCGGLHMHNERENTNLKKKHMRAFHFKVVLVSHSSYIFCFQLPLAYTCALPFLFLSLRSLIIQPCAIYLSPKSASPPKKGERTNTKRRPNPHLSTPPALSFAASFEKCRKSQQPQTREFPLPFHTYSH